MFKQKLVNKKSQSAIMAEILMGRYKAGTWNGKDSVIKMRGERKFDVSKMDGIKKMLKYTYKEEFPVGKRYRMKGLINEFCHVPMDGESSVNVWIFEKSDEARKVINRHIDLEGDRNYYDYSPTGLWFRDPADVKEFDDRIVVIQRAILDC